MTINVEQALRTLEIYGQEINRKMVKEAYRRLCSKYHPDKNPSGLTQMQNINVAYDYLSGVSDTLLNAFSAKPKPKEEPKEKPRYSTPDEFEWFRRRGMDVWDDGDKVYIDGQTYPYREELKAQRYRWNPDEKHWWRYL